MGMEWDGRNELYKHIKISFNIDKQKGRKK